MEKIHVLVLSCKILTRKHKNMFPCIIIFIFPSLRIRTDIANGVVASSINCTTIFVANINFISIVFELHVANNII